METNSVAETRSIETSYSTVLLEKIKKITAYREFMLFLIILIGAVVTSFLTPAFLSVINLRSTALGFSTTGIIAVGMTIALILGGLDLSVGAVFGLSGIVTAILWHDASMNIWVAAVVGILSGVSCGVINGLLIGKMKLNPLVTTLSMMIMGRGLAMYFSEGKLTSMRTVSESFRFLGKGALWGIPNMLIIFVIIAVVAHFVSKRSVSMRKVFYIGSNEKAAVFTGIDVEKIKIGVYTLVAFLASIAGVISISRFGVAVPTGGVGIEMTTIAAAVIGGASLGGGEGSVIGTVLGIILLSLIANILILLDVSVYLQQFVSGLILIFAVILDHYNKKRLDSVLKHA